MKTVVSLFTTLWLLTLGVASAQSFDGATLSLDAGASFDSGGVVIINGNTGGGTFKAGSGTLVVSHVAYQPPTAILTLNPVGDSGNPDSNPVLPVTLDGSGNTFDLLFAPGSLTFGTTYDLNFSSTYIYDPSLSGGLTLYFQASPEPPAVFLFALSLIGGAGALMLRSLRLRSV